MSGTPDLGKMVNPLSRYNNSSIKTMIVSLLPTVFTGHHFAQPRGQAERSREAVSAPLSGSRRLRRETLNGSSRGRSRRRRRRERATHLTQSVAENFEERDELS